MSVTRPSQISAGIVGTVIRNGDVADVASGVLVKRDVGIAGDRIVALAEPGRLAGERVVDASGCVVSPGFVDIHSHSDTFPLIDPSARSKLCDGVTTEIAGNCGFSPFPARGPERKQEQREADRHGLVVDWANAQEFFERAERAGSAINRGYLVGHGRVRAVVMGYENRPPTAQELAAMRAEVASALEAGALGLSSGLAYAPGCFCGADELTALCRVVAEHGGLYSTHMRSEGDGLEKAVEEALTVGKTSGARLQISHVKTTGQRNWGKISWLKDRLFRAREEGVDVTCDRYPYIAGSTGLHFVLPDWAKEGGPEAELKRLTDPSMRKKVAEAVAANYPDPASWQRIVVSCVPGAANKRYEGKCVAEIARLSGSDPISAVFDLLTAEKLDVDAIIFSMCEENLREILTWPFVAIGSDASFRCPEGPLSEGKPHPRAYGTFSRVLRRYVREQGVLGLVEALRKMTLLPAQRAGLARRGAIEKGWFADIVVFDPAAVEDRATFEDPHQCSKGIEYVFVNGKMAVNQGVPLGGLHGAILRRT